MSAGNRPPVLGGDLGGTAGAPSIEGLQGEDLPDSVASTLLKRNAANTAWETVSYTGSNLTTDLSGKAASSHTHAESDVTNLTTDLAAKAAHATTITAGAGLTGGGDLSTNRTLDVAANADGSIVVNANDIQVGVINATQHGTLAGGTTHADAIAAGAAGFMSGSDKTKVDGLAAVTTKGDLVTYSTVPARLGVGTNGHVLTADSTQTLGIKWAAAAGGGSGKNLNYFRNVGTSLTESWYQAASIMGSLGSGTVDVDVIHAVPFFSTTARTVDRIAFKNTNATGSALVGIYANTSDTVLYPAAKLLTGTEQSLSSTAIKPSTVSYSMVADTLYWFVFVCGTNSPTMATILVSNAMGVLGFDSAMTGMQYGWRASRAYDSTLPDPYPASASVMLQSHVIPAVTVRFSA